MLQAFRSQSGLLPAVVLLIVLYLLSPASANVIHTAFSTYYGKAAANATEREALLSHLDELLAVATLKPGEKLRMVNDYMDARSRQLGLTVVPSLTTATIDEWADRVIELVPKLDNSQSFPLVRRLVVASLLKLWLKEGQRLPEASSEKLKEVMVKLYEKHRLGAAQKAIMEYLHISKSGGTSWCHVAELNGCVTERYDKSYVCQIKKFDDKVRWLNMTYHMMQVPVYRVPKYVLNRFSRYGNYRKSHTTAACNARHRYMHAHGYNYYSNEYTVHGGHEDVKDAHICSDFFNAIVMRDPLKRLVSHMKFVMWTMSGDRGYNDTELFNMMYKDRTSSFWQELGPAIVDNYFTRSLLGEKAYHTPLGGVTQEMLSMAQQMLAQFDLIMVLEQEMDVRNLILYYGVGWRHTLEEVHDKDSRERETVFNTSSYIPADLHRLLQGQALDQHLHRFARTVAHLDPVVFMVAREAGLTPLPKGMAASEAVQCGMLRGNDNAELLEKLGVRAAGKKKKSKSKMKASSMRRNLIGEEGRAWLPGDERG
ncbi:hypothetical protein Agub_g13009, partial [Astrephomene gubernaculifera]